MRTRLLRAGETDVAAELLKGGGVVAVPTETVYGLAANGLDAAAVRKIFAAKGRAETKPISLFAACIEDAERFCVVDGRRSFDGKSGSLFNIDISSQSKPI